MISGLRRRGRRRPVHARCTTISSPRSRSTVAPPSSPARRRASVARRRSPSPRPARPWCSPTAPRTGWPRPPPSSRASARRRSCVPTDVSQTSRRSTTSPGRRPCDGPRRRLGQRRRHHPQLKHRRHDQESDLDAIVAVNLKGVYWGIAAAGRVMSAAKRGSIINVASAGGEMPAPTLSVYGMTKAGVIQLTRTAAAELGPSRHPGQRRRPRVHRDPDDAASGGRRPTARSTMPSGRRPWASGGAQSPLGTIGEPSDIAYAMLYLAVDAARSSPARSCAPTAAW